MSRLALAGPFSVALGVAVLGVGIWSRSAAMASAGLFIALSGWLFIRIVEGWSL